MTTPKFTSLVDMQLKSCERFASRPLFGTKRDGTYGWTTYAEFGAMVAQIRGALAHHGVGKGDRVSVIANNRVEWAVAAYATYGLGAQYVPMYEAQLAKDWKYILEDASAKVLIVSTEAILDDVKDFPDELEALERVICIEADPSEENSWANQLEIGTAHPADPYLPSEEEWAGLIYTSGTTGQPKGVVLSHGNFVSNINAVHEIFPISPDDVSLSFLPWAHSFGQTCELHCMMSAGASMGLAESVQTLIDNFGEVRPTLLFSVPRIFNRIYDGLQKRMEDESGLKRFLFYKGLEVARKKRELRDQGQESAWLNIQYGFFNDKVFSKVRDRFGGRLKYAFSGGAALSREVAEFIDDIGIQVYEGYGLSETSPIASANSPEARRIGTIGKPIPGVEIVIVDPEDPQKVLPDGEVGEIVIIGPNVMQEYLNKPEATEEAIYDLDGKRAFRSGDMGQKDTDGFIRITGRFKEQYKLENGKYVVPSPLEELLKLSGFINQVFLHGDNKPYNVALVVPDFEALAKWAQKQGISDTSPEGLVKNDRCHARIGEELRKYSDGFKGYERPQRWTLIIEEFSTDNDMLTPSMKVKRRNVLKAYSDLLESLYDEG
ncbi:MAG: long-chain fatty acid--CoA ligase [Deltaproteobacteria bacterium]|nr:MAG: long-chain fatty acid--CoA ligase [Deltaproteobacteria bacterium]